MHQCSKNELLTKYSTGVDEFNLTYIHSFMLYNKLNKLHINQSVTYIKIDQVGDFHKLYILNKLIIIGALAHIYIR